MDDRGSQRRSVEGLSVCRGVCLDRRSDRFSPYDVVVLTEHWWTRPLLDRDMAQNAYRVELGGNRLRWVTREGDKEVRFDSEPEASLWKRIKVRVLSWLPIEDLLELPPKPTLDLMRQFLASIFTLLLTASIALGLDAQTKAEIDELISYVQTSGVRFIRNGLEYSGAEGAQHLRDKLAKAGDRVKTTEDFITGIASKSFLSGKPYLVKFADGHTQPTGEWLRAHLAEMRENKR